MKKVLRELVYYGLIFILLLLMNMAKICGTIAPFGFAFLFALIYLNKNPYVLAVIFVASKLIIDYSMVTFLISFFVAVVAIMSRLFHKIINKKMNFFMCAIYLALSFAVFIKYNAIDTTHTLQTIATIMLSEMFLYICVCALSALFSRGLYAKFAFDENVCLGVLISACALGLFDVYVFDVWILTSITCFAVLFLANTLGNNSALYFATMCGVGVCFGNSSIVALAIFVAYATSVVAVKDVGKVASVLAMLLVDFVIGIFLNGYAVYGIANVVAVLFGSVIFMLIPNRKFEKIRAFIGENDAMSLALVLSKTKSEIKKKIMQTSEIFYCLSESYKKLVSGNLNNNEVIDAIKLEIKSKICSKCENRINCEELCEKNIDDGITNLAIAGLAKGKVNVVDVSSLISTYCNKVTSMLSLVNDDVQMYKKFCGKMQEENKGKLEISEQFMQTSIMLNSLGQKINTMSKRNEGFEKRITAELLFYDIIAKEVNVFEDSFGVQNVVVVVRSKGIDEKQILKVINQILKIKFKLDKKEFAEISGWSVLNFIKAPHFETVLGVSKLSKNKQVSGDNNEVFAINNHQVMAVLCDGMGSGKDASDLSNVALSILTNFFKAGYSSEFVLKNVNKFLNYSTKEIFTSVDICLIDTFSAQANFFKMGSSLSVIKKRNKCFAISPEALPIGIVENVKLKSQRCVLETGDIIVLASDGVVDSFSSTENYIGFVNNIRLINAQLIADTIIEQARYNYKAEIKDDMTVLVMRLVEAV